MRVEILLGIKYIDFIDTINVFSIYTYTFSYELLF